MRYPNSGLKILLINQKGLTHNNEFWSPPGGGVNFGETIESCLIREFEEETGLKTKQEELLVIDEFIKAPYHAIELFYKVSQTGGKLELGKDPELERQIIDDFRWFSLDDLMKLAEISKHGCLRGVSKILDLLGPNQP